MDRSEWLRNQRYLSFISSDKEIKQLVIFEESRPTNGRLNTFDGEDSPVQCEHLVVPDLNKFFKDPVALARLASIEKLIIYGRKEEETVVDFELAKFDRLAYLELHHLLFVNPNILRSFRLRHLVLNGANHLMGKMGSLDGTISGMPSPVYYSGLAELQSDNLRYLAFSTPFDENAFGYVLERGLLQAIERLYFVPADLNSLYHLSENYSTLKRIDLACKSGVLELLTACENFLKILVELREDLSIFIGGIPLRQQTLFRILQAAKRLNPSSDYLVEREEFILENENEFTDSTGFRQDYLPLMKFDDSHRQTKVDHCKKIKFYMLRFEDLSEERILKSFSDLREISIKCHPEMANEIYGDLIQWLKRHSQITYLALELWNYFDYTFLLEFRQLRQLSLRMMCPISHDTILELLLELEQLEYLDILLPKPTDLSIDDLIGFQQLVEDQFTDRFASKGLKFTVKVMDFCIELVRYQLKNEKLMPIDAHIWSNESMMRMYHVEQRVKFQSLLLAKKRLHIPRQNLN